MATLGLGGETTSLLLARPDSHRRLFDSNLVDVANALFPNSVDSSCDLSGLDAPVDDSTSFVCNDNISLVTGTGDANGVAESVVICDEISAILGSVCADILYTDGNPATCEVAYLDDNVCQSCEICGGYSIEVDCTNLEDEGSIPPEFFLPPGCNKLGGPFDSPSSGEGPMRVSVGASIVGMLVAFSMIV